MGENSHFDSPKKMPPDFSAKDIRALAEEDLPAVLAVEIASQPRPWSKDSFQNELNNPASTVNVIWHGNEVVGYICYHTLLDELNILNLVTAPFYRRLGVARLLLDVALADGVRNSVQKVFLEVRKGNRAAIALYQSFGFQLLGCRKGYYADGDDALIMLKELFENI
ncbi:MAG: ribosomal protein S18-alanine N-acetyltransferase [Deltaproteobacteria bacterium]|nr:ribosomal protein S18-alanine N-acetyltransferase [Deltaproteobacteria bacterium]